jgi:aspartate racemase
MVQAARNLQAGGVDFIVIATNTMHLMAPDIEKATGLKVLHIADATGDEILRRKVKKVLLLGTKFTMEGDFYRDRLHAKGIEVVIPDEADRQIIHDIIYHELILGDIKEESKKAYVNIIEKMAQQGAGGVVLGCTEIPLLIRDEDVPIEVFDTTTLHAKAAVRLAIES